jgi:hypothetical protein
MSFLFGKSGPFIAFFLLLVVFFVLLVLVFSYSPEENFEFSPSVDFGYDYTVDDGIMSLSINNEFKDTSVRINIVGDAGSEEFTKSIELGDNLITLDVSSVGEISDVEILPLI